MKGLTIGVTQDLQDLARDRAIDGLQEIEQQLWVEFSGRAEEFAVWAEREIDFEQHFIDATGQRDSPFDRPHFTFGAVLDTSTPVGVCAVVLEYKTNDRNETIGAKIAIGILATDQSVNVRGRVNLTFQGYGQAPSGLADDIGVE
jgi:hypothetical protein